MTDQDRINSILSSIQTDSQLFILLRLMITNNIGNLDTAHLTAMQQALGLPTS